MAEFSHSDIAKLEKLIKKYSDSTNIYIKCLGSDREVLFDYACSEEEKNIISQLADDNLVNELFSRVALDGIEDQAVDNTLADEVKIAASSIRTNGKCRCVFIAVAVLAGGNENEELSGLKRRTTFNGFLQAVDVLRDLVYENIKARMSAVQSEEMNRQSQDYANELAESLRKVSTMTEILKLLDDTKPLETIMTDFLSVTSGFLYTKYAMIVKLTSDDTMDICAQWNMRGLAPIYAKTHAQKRLSFIEGNKPLILSNDYIAQQYADEIWDDIDVSAIVAMPVPLVGRTDMYVVYIETTDVRKWRVDELQFLSDAVRILQSTLEKRIHKNSIASSYASLQEVLEHVGCAIVVLDDESRKVLFENQLMKALFGGDKMSKELNEILWTKHEKKEVIEFYDYSNYYEIHCNNISWVDGRNVALYAIYDVTDKKFYQKRIEQQAYTDFLTGLYNRFCCERDLAKTIDEAKKNNQTGALLYLDLDDFKHINDGLGHQYGDVLLKDISTALRSVKGLEENCYRMGGDEFVIIVTPPVYDEYDRIISDIKNIFATPFFLKDGEYYCTMSMGVVIFPEEGDKVAELVQKADVAMYESKKSGKNRVSMYVSGSSSDANKRLDMEKNMRDATASDFEEFLVYYQPVIDIQSEDKKCIGAEALVRWDSRELGFISPADFIPLAEYLGLINPIGDHVLHEACVYLKKWNENGHPDFKVSVNLSVVQLMQNDIVDRIKNVVEETGINPRNLTLEVTESLAINDMDRMKGIMNAIRELGIKISLDDFGTGYSSLNHIREIPLDILKVDQSFVRELADDDYSQSFIEMVSRLAGAIKVSICVEGVETAAQEQILRGMGISMVQGYYFDKPMSRDSFEKKYMQP